MIKPMADILKAGDVKTWLALYEVQKAVKTNRDNVAKDVEMWIAEDYEYNGLEDTYEEGYINALDWVIRLIEEGEIANEIVNNY